MTAEGVSLSRAARKGDGQSVSKHHWLAFPVGEGAVAAAFGLRMEALVVCESSAPVGTGLSVTVTLVVWQWFSYWFLRGTSGSESEGDLMDFARIRQNASLLVFRRGR